MLNAFLKSDLMTKRKHKITKLAFSYPVCECIFTYDDSVADPPDPYTVGKLRLPTFCRYNNMWGILCVVYTIKDLKVSVLVSACTVNKSGRFGTSPICHSAVPPESIAQPILPFCQSAIQQFAIPPFRQ